MKTYIDIIRSGKPPKSGTHYSHLTLDPGTPVPAVGDTVVVWKGQRAKLIEVERRVFCYLKDSLHLQLFFSRAE